MRFVRPFLLTLIIGLSLSCSHQSQVPRFYVLDWPSPDSAPSVATIDATCFVSPVELTAAFASERIAVRMDSHELQYYARHAWAVMPDDLVRDVIQEGVTELAIFKEVAVESLTPPAEYVLETHISTLEAVQEHGQLAAHLQGQFRLRDTATDHAVIVHHFDQHQPLPASDLNDFAATTSQLLQQALVQFVEKIDGALPN